MGSALCPLRLIQEKHVSKFPPHIAMNERQPLADYTFHPLTQTLPLLEGEEFDAFLADVKQHGQREEIYAIGRQIIDGRNLYRACRAAHIQPRVMQRTDLLSTEQIAAFLSSRNLMRRHLKTGQRAAFAAVLADVLAAEAKKRQRDHAGTAPGRKRDREEQSVGFPVAKLSVQQVKNKNTPCKFAGSVATSCGDDKAGSGEGEACAVAARIAGVSARSVYATRAIRGKSPELFKAVQSGEINVHQAGVRARKSDRLAALDRAESRADHQRELSGDEWRIVHGDCLQELARLKRAGDRPDLIFLDPPYNNGWRYDADPTHDRLSPDQYLSWCREWMALCADALADHGSMFVLIDGNYTDQFGVLMRQVGLHRRNTILWWEHFPSYQRGNFTPAVRFIHYYTKSPTHFVWNPENILEPSRRNQIGDSRGEPGGKVPDNVWQISRKVGNAADRVPFDDAPPQIPTQLAERCILAASNPGSLVIDPFNGNGTTGLAALQHGRRYIGIERSAKYARQSQQWIRACLSGEREPVKTS